MPLAHAMRGVASDFQDDPQQTTVTQLREDFVAVIKQAQHPSQEGEETTLTDHVQQLTSNLNQLDLETPARATLSDGAGNSISQQRRGAFLAS